MPSGLQYNRPFRNPPLSWPKSMHRDEDHSLSRQRPTTSNTTVYELEMAGPVSMEQLMSKHANVFSPGVGLLEGKYHIVLEEIVTSVQHPPQRVPVPLRDVLKTILDDLVEQNIIAPVHEPTPWI